VIVISFTPSSH